MHDNEYDIDAIFANINKVKNYSRFSDVKIGYWDWRNSKFSNFGKVSPSDLGKENLEYIINNEIVMIGEDEYSEEEL